MRSIWTILILTVLIVGPLPAAGATNSSRLEFAGQEAELQNDSPVEAQKAFDEGKLLRAKGTAESLREAIAKYTEAMSLWKAAGDVKAEAAALDDIGEVYSALGEKQRALDCYHQALPLRRAVGDQVGEAETLINIGVVHSVLGEKLKALESIFLALRLARDSGDQRGEAYALGNIGRIYIDLGEPQKTLEYYSQTLPLVRALGDRRGESYMLGNIGAAYWTLAENQKAMEYYDQALPLMRALNDRRGEAFVLSSIGKVYSDLGEPQKAIEHFNQALPLAIAGGELRGEAYILGNIGAACSLLGELQKAMEYYSQALPLMRKTEDRVGEIIALYNIGKGYSDLGEPQKAIEHYNQALSIARAVGDSGKEAKALGGIAGAESNRGNLLEARAHIESALNIIESLRNKVAAQDLRTAYFASNQDYYDFYIDLLMRLHQIRPTAGYDALALEACERTRARSLLDSLAESSADIRQGIDPELAERERSLQQRLNAKERYRIQLLSGKHTQEQAEAAVKELQTLLDDYREVQAEIRRKSPRYAALTQPQQLSLKEIQQILDDDTLLLEYALGKERSYLWAVTRTSIMSFELPKQEDIESAARRVYELLTVSNKRESKRQTELAAAELSRIVLAPAAAQLNKKRLLIVSAGALQYVPFAALPVPQIETAKKSSRGLRGKKEAVPLIVEHEITALPSVSTLAALRREFDGREPAGKTLAVFADPVLDGEDERVNKALASSKPKEPTTDARRPTPDLTRSAKEIGVERFERLRFTRDEAEAIAAQAPKGESLKALDFDASRAAVASAELDQYQVIHFATHGILNSRHPELSGMVLSLVDENGKPQDGFLRAHEVYNLKLRAELVVLSACRTALGKEVKGEGLVGLVRGFMYAGAKRVVAGMWDVRDEATAELMKRFYKGMLKDGLKPAAALRAAQVSMLKEDRWKAPYYWAGFVIQGE